MGTATKVARAGHRLLLASAALGALACGGSERGGGGALVVRDSAGVLIAESARPRWAPGEGFTVSEAPTLTLGDDAAAPEGIFGSVRDAARLEDGSVAVIDGQAGEVRRYAADGSFAGLLGRRGEGPGEFQGPWSLEVLPGDTVSVFDRRQRRVTLIAPGGGEPRVVSTPLSFRPDLPDEVPSESCCIPVGVGAGGALFWRHPDVWTTLGPGPRPTWARLVRFAPDGARVDTLGPFVSGTAAPWDGPNRVIPVNFSTRLSVRVAADRIYLGNGSHLGYQTLDLEGVQTMAVRGARPRRAVTEEWLRGWREREAERFGTGAEATPERVRAIVERAHADSLPAFTDLHVDPLGYVWLIEWLEAGPRTAGPASAQVFAPDGLWLGTVPLPAGLWVLRIGRDHVLGLQLGGMDEPLVVIHDLERGSGG